MSPSPTPLFPSCGERGYDAAAVETFPWPVLSGYADVHRWMDQGQAVHAVWQLKDVWEGLLKFLASLAVADHMASAPAEAPRTNKLLTQLLQKNGLTDGAWATLLKIALQDGPLPRARVPQLSSLLFQGGKRGPLYRLFISDKDDLKPDDFISWRNSCFGHGVFRKDLCSYAEDARLWLRRLHEVFDLCRPVLTSLVLESDGPNGEILTWGEKSPLPFYHGHEPAAAGPLLPPVRVRTPGSEALLLTPLLSVQLCAVCGQWTAFYLDKYDPDKHGAQFLDFVEGHSNKHKDVEPLRTWAARMKAGKGPAVAPKEAAPEERREPDPERFRDFQHEFEPPVYLARQVADFLRAHDRGVVALTGPGGVGKSWATLGLDQAGMLPAQLGRAVPLLNVSMHGPTAPRASQVRTALDECARREKRWQVPAWPDGPEPYTRFAAWLAALMRANGLGELVVALDGLDDLPADSDVPDLWPPAGKLPPGCYLVLSTRPGVRPTAESGLRRVRSMPDYFCELRVGLDEPEHRAVLRSYVAKRLARPHPDREGPLPGAWADPLINQAGGSFLYVFHYCQALHFGVYADLSQLPPPAAYYPAFFAHLRGRVGDELFHRYYARALALIAVVREPVGMTHLETCGLERSRLVVMLDDLADLLRSRREPWDAETLYSLGHDVIRQFLTEDTYWQSRLAGANRDLAKLAVRRFGKDWSAVDPFDPVERYLLFHLLDHATGPDLCNLLADTALADACQKHGNALLEKGEFAACLLVFDMALRLREDQVHRQGCFELRNELVSAYMNRGTVLSNLAREEEALADFDAALALYAVSAHDDARQDLREELARVHLNRGRTLRMLGRPEEALADYGICIDQLEELVHGDGRRDLRDLLALAHNNLGVALNALGRLEEALGDYGTCIALREELVQCDGRHELRNDLAFVYANRGITLAGLGRFEEALTDYGASIKLEEEIVRHEPCREMRHYLAVSYMYRSIALTDLGRLDEALADCSPCVSLLEELVLREGRGELRGDLAMAYLNRGRTLGSLGRREEALADYGTCIGLREELVQREGRRELHNELATAYMNRGCELSELGRLDEALADFGVCIGLRHELVQREGRRELRNDLAIAYMNRGNALAGLGRLEEALRDYDICIEFEEELVRYEGRRELAGQLAWGYAELAKVLLQMGRQKEACQRAREAVSILQSEATRTGRAALRRVLELAEEVARKACGAPD